MTQRFLRPLILALAGLLAAPVLSRAVATNLALAKSEILEGNVAYLRVSHVAAGLPDEIGAANRALTATNKIAGTVLDLRFADGDDAAAATATANLFAAKKLPLAILVNGQTRGAAVTLATTLREARAGLVFGDVAAAVKPDNFRRGKARLTKKRFLTIPTRRRQPTQSPRCRAQTSSCPGWTTPPRRIWSGRKSRMATNLKTRRRRTRRVHKGR